MPSFSEIDFIGQGRNRLSQGDFPGDIIEGIKDKRVRKLVADAIFLPDKSYHDFTEKERIWRAKIWKVQAAFLDYLTVKDKLKPALALLFMAGFLAFVTAYIGANGNLFYGISAMIQGTVLYYIAWRGAWLSNKLLIVAFTLLAIFLLELLIFGWPESYFSFMYKSDNLGAAIDYEPEGAAFTLMIDQLTLLGFYAIKLGTIAVMFWAYFKRNLFLKQKAELQFGD